MGVATAFPSTKSIIRCAKHVFGLRNLFEQLIAVRAKLSRHARSACYSQLFGYHSLSAEQQLWLHPVQWLYQQHFPPTLSFFTSHFWCERVSVFLLSTSMVSGYNGDDVPMRGVLLSPV